MWISKKNEERFRKENCQPTQTQRTQTADDRVSFRFPKTARLLSKAHYQRVSRFGLRFSGEFLVIDYFLGELDIPKLGMTVSRRFGKAHQRNRFKRLVREAFRHALPYLPKNLQLNVLPKAAMPLSPASISKDIDALLEKIHAECGARKSG